MSILSDISYNVGPPSYKFVYKPHQLESSYKYQKNSDIVIM